MQRIKRKRIKMSDQQGKALFPLGQVVATPGAVELGIDFLPYLAMHSRGYWGDVGQEDWAENDLSVERGLSDFIGLQYAGGQDLDYYGRGQGGDDGFAAGGILSRTKKVP
jgi:hypothetical protein